MDTTRPAQPFRFLDLPTELRLMVYEFLPVRTHHHTFKYPVTDPNEPPIGDVESDVTLVEKTIDVRIPATCQLVNVEATPILNARLDRLREEPWHFIVDSPSLRAFFGGHDLFYRVLKEFCSNTAFSTSDVTIESVNYVEAQFQSFLGKLSYDGLQSLVRFFLICARFRNNRTPSSTLLVIRRHPAEDLLELAARAAGVVGKAEAGGFDEMPYPIGFALGLDVMDAEDSPSTTYPGGFIRDMLRHYVTLHPFRSDPRPPTVHMGDLSQAVWWEVWQEGDQFET
jgi:hypothetical protein